MHPHPPGPTHWPPDDWLEAWTDYILARQQGQMTYFDLLYLWCSELKTTPEHLEKEAGVYSDQETGGAYETY